MFEAWLSMQRCDVGGLTFAGCVPTVNDSDASAPLKISERAIVVPIHTAITADVASMYEKLQGKDPYQVQEHFRNPDILVTNQGDKDIQLTKLIEVHGRVQENMRSGSMGAGQEARHHMSACFRRQHSFRGSVSRSGSAKSGLTVQST